MKNKKRLVLSIAICRLPTATIFSGIAAKPPKPKNKPDLDWDDWTNLPHMFSMVTGNVGIGANMP